MSENWNAWNPNMDDEEEQESPYGAQEQQPEPIDWGELFSDKKEESDTDTDIFSSNEGDDIFGRLMEGANEADGENEDGEEAHALQEQVDDSASQAEQPDDEAALTDTEAAENNSTDVEDIVAEEVDGAGNEQHDELADDSVLEIEKPQPSAEEEQDVEINSPAESEEEPVEDIAPEQPTSEAEDARPETGDQSPIVNESEAEEMQQHFDESAQPEETILDEPTVLEDEPEQVESKDNRYDKNETVAAGFEDDTESSQEEEKKSEDSSSSFANSRRGRRGFRGHDALGVGSAIPDSAEAATGAAQAAEVGQAEASSIPAKETEIIAAAAPVEAEEDAYAGSLRIEHDNEQDQADIVEVDNEEEELADAPKQEQLQNTDAETIVETEDDDSEDGNNVEELAKAAALSAAGIEAAHHLNNREEELNDENESVITNQELSGRTEQEHQLADEEVNPELLDRNDEVDLHDPEAENFDTRQEVLSQNDKSLVDGEHMSDYSPNDAVPISDILQNRDNELQQAYPDAETIGSQALTGANEQPSAAEQYKTSIIIGVVSAFIIIIGTIVYMIYK